MQDRAQARKVVATAHPKPPDSCRDNVEDIQKVVPVRRAAKRGREEVVDARQEAKVLGGGGADGFHGAGADGARVGVGEKGGGVCPENVPELGGARVRCARVGQPTRSAVCRLCVHTSIRYTPAVRDCTNTQ